VRSALILRKMAGNDWINGYLEAILDAGAGFAEAETRPALTVRDGGGFNPTKYFVEEVVTGFDESDLHRTWIKVKYSALHIL
jgi:sucrose-phosphate synthase